MGGALAIIKRIRGAARLVEHRGRLDPCPVRANQDHPAIVLKIERNRFTAVANRGPAAFVPRARPGLAFVVRIGLGDGPRPVLFDAPLIPNARLLGEVACQRVGAFRRPFDLHQPDEHAGRLGRWQILDEASPPPRVKRPDQAQQAEDAPQQRQVGQKIMHDGRCLSWSVTDRAGGKRIASGTFPFREHAPAEWPSYLLRLLAGNEARTPFLLVTALATQRAPQLSLLRGGKLPSVSARIAGSVSTSPALLSMIFRVSATSWWTSTYRRSLKPGH